MSRRLALKSSPMPTYVANGSATPILNEMMTCHICNRRRNTYSGKRPRPDLAYAVQCSTCFNIKFFNPVCTPATSTLIGYEVSARLGSCADVEWTTM